MTRHADLPTGRVRYLEAGSGPVLLLVHAFPLAADQWAAQLAAPPPGWRLVAPDLRGFGRDRGASLAALEGVSVADYAADLVALLDHLEVERAVIAGLSMGGYVAFGLLRAAAARVAGLVLADTRAGADSAAGRAARDRMLELVDREGAAGVAREMLPKLLGPTTRSARPAVVETVGRMIEGTDPAAIAAAVRALKERPDSSPLLAEITCPVLVLCGEEDTLTPPADAEALQQGIVGAVLELLPGAGHLSNLEAPLAFNASLGAFLGRL